MGYDKDRHQITNTMKAFIFLCLVAAAMAEADPQFLYGNYFPSTYAYGGAYSPYTYGYNFFHYPSTYGYGLHNYGYSGLYNHGIYSGIHTYGKREAEAEPWRSYYGGYSGYRPYSGYGYGGFGGYRGYRGWY